ncbi:MAG: hypothetical protein HYY08_03530 [Firmicutes bacterium]|nr:hypothetical protein [Bacillota bacterium]
MPRSGRRFLLLLVPRMKLGLREQLLGVPMKYVMPGVIVYACKGHGTDRIVRAVPGHVRPEGL